MPEEEILEVKSTEEAEVSENGNEQLETLKARIVELERQLLEKTATINAQNLIIAKQDELISAQKGEIDGLKAGTKVADKPIVEPTPASPTDIVLSGVPVEPNPTPVLEKPVEPVDKAPEAEIKSDIMTPEEMKAFRDELRNADSPWKVWMLVTSEKWSNKRWVSKDKNGNSYTSNPLMEMYKDAMSNAEFDKVSSLKLEGEDKKSGFNFREILMEGYLKGYAYSADKGVLVHRTDIKWEDRASTILKNTDEFYTIESLINTLNRNRMTTAGTGDFNLISSSINSLKLSNDVPTAHARKTSLRLKITRDLGFREAFEKAADNFIEQKFKLSQAPKGSRR